MSDYNTFKLPYVMLERHTLPRGHIKTHKSPTGPLFIILEYHHCELKLHQIALQSHCKAKITVNQKQWQHQHLPICCFPFLSKQTKVGCKTKILPVLIFKEEFPLKHESSK